MIIFISALAGFIIGVVVCALLLDATDALVKSVEEEPEEYPCQSYLHGEGFEPDDCVYELDEPAEWVRRNQDDAVLFDVEARR